MSYIIIGIVLFTLFIFLFTEGIKYEEEKKKKEKEKKAQEQLKRYEDKVYNEIISDYIEMKQEPRFQQVMSDLSKVIDANESDIVYIHFSHNSYSYKDVINIRLQDIDDKWCINPQRKIEFDIDKYKLRFNQHAFLYWIIQKYPFMTYHSQNMNSKRETRSLKKARFSWDKDGDQYDCSTFIYKIGTDKKYWI